MKSDDFKKSSCADIFKSFISGVGNLFRRKDDKSSYKSEKF